MASSYEARINLIVQGEQKVKALQDRITALSKQLKELTKLDVGGTFEESLVSGAISKLRVARQGEIKAVDGVVKGQRLINQNTESQLLKQLRLNAAVDLYGRRLKALSRTDAGDQKQFQGRIADIQKAFTFFKGKGSVQGVQAAATELGRIVEYSREVNRLETGRLKSQEKLQGFAAEISKFKALGLNTAKAEKAFESFAVNAGTNKYALAQKFNDILIRRLRLLKDESRENTRIAKQQFGASSPIQGAVDLIGSPINKAMGTKAAVALAQQKQKAAADELKALQGGTKSAVALAQQKQKAAADELKALQGGTKSAVALAQQKQKAAADELKALQGGTKSAVALAQQKQKAAADELKALQGGTKSAVALAQQKQKAAADELKALQGGTKSAVALAQQKQKAAADELKALQDGTKAAVSLAKQKQQALDAQRKNRNAMIQNALIGGAFPMLFGGGAGAVIGGAAGGFIPGNPMMSIVTSALGTVVDQFAAAATEMGASLRDPITNFEKLKETNLFASKAQEFYIQKLIETGRITEATGAIQAQIIRKVGVAGFNDLTKLAEASTRLTKELAGVTEQAQALTAGPLSGILNFLTDMLKLSNEFVKLNAETLAPLFKLLFGTGDTKPTTPPPVKIDPATQEQAIKAAEQVADTIKGAYRTGFQLQQQALDLQRQGTDLQRRVADDIFNKQQQIARLQIDNERQRQQIAIETVDLEYRRRISQEEGRVAEALAAEADLLKTRAKGEASIATAKRLLELDITKQRRDTENYVYQLGREIENIRRSTLNYEMQVADYRLDIERKVAAERRVENAGEISGAVTGGKSGVTATSVAGFPITSRQGMRTHPVTGGQRMHAGTDIGTPMNTALAYSVGGVVTKVTTMGGYGKVLEVKLENGVTAFAAHLNSVLVKVGEKFGPKQLLARTGKTGLGTGPHLHMEGTRGGDSTAALPFLVLDGKASKVTAKSSTASQLTTAGSQVTDRPGVPLVDAGGAGAALVKLDAQDAAIRKEAVTLQERLNKLQESAALQRLEEVARGPIDLQQRRDAVQYAKEDLSVVKAGNSDLQERLAFEAQSLVKLQIRTDRDKEILDNTKLQGDERKKLEDALQKGLEITRQQIELDREGLRLAQEKRFAIEEANIQSQLGVTGAGLQAGFVGPAAGAFESEMLKSGNTEQATRLAELTNQLTLAQVQAQGMERSVLAIGDAFGTAMTSGVASLINGTASAEQVFAQFLDTIAQALLKAAADMIAAYIAIGIAKMFAGLGSNTGGGNAATALGSNPNVAAYAPLPIGFAEGGFVTGPTNAVIGEGGESEYVIPASKMNAAMSRYGRGARGEGVIAGNGTTSEGGAPSATGPVAIDVRYSVERINNVEYVTASQFQEGMRQAAQQGAAQGEQRTLRRLQQSPSTRKRVGV